MRGRIKLTGKKFGMLSVLQDDKDPKYVAPPRGKSRNRYVLCQCDCGNQTSVRVDHLRFNRIKSCGCARAGDAFSGVMKAIMAGDDSAADVQAARHQAVASSARALRNLAIAQDEARKEDISRAPRQTEAERKFNLEPGQYDALLAAQGGVCGICGERPTYGALHVDHCHGTDRVRGLLCRRCNLGLGHFEDDVMRLARAMKYLTTVQPVKIATPVP